MHPNKQKRKRVLSEKKRDLMNGFYSHLKGQRYSLSTVKSYSYLVADFMEFMNEMSIECITNSDVDLYLAKAFEPQGYSISTQRQLISGLKLFKKYCPECGLDSIELIRPKRSRKLPVVLSKMEVINLIRCTKNLKHRAIIAMLYSSGLRISELLNLRLTDINIERRQILIRSGKGRKDRYVVLSEGMLPLLQNYLKTYSPHSYYVEGPKGRPYTASSVRKFLTRSAKEAGISKKITPHTLRHSYATHLLENGVNLRHIQLLLGHAKPETTMIYTHVMKKDLLDIQSPLDTILKQLRQESNNDEQKFLISG